MHCLSHILSDKIFGLGFQPYGAALSSAANQNCETAHPLRQVFEFVGVKIVLVYNRKSTIILLDFSTSSPDTLTTS